jgi:hypothetical protein
VKYLLKFIALLLIIIAFLCAPPAHAQQTIYIAQTAQGAGTGASCANAYALGFFNTSGNWAGSFTSGKISPGTTVQICTNISGTTGSTAFTFQGSGTSGHPITLQFAPGVILAAPEWGTGAINGNGQSYIVIDGNGLQGTIENTLEGTIGAACIGGPCTLSDNNDTYGVNCITGGTSVTIKNLNIINMYVMNSLADNNGQSSYGIQCGYGNNLTYSGNLIHDVKWAISSGQSYGTYAGYQINGNTIYNCDHGIFFNITGGTQNGPVNIFGNDIQTGTTWDNTADSNHHDNIHISGNGVVGGLPSIPNPVYIYNNYVHGDPGAQGNSYLYSFPGSPSPYALLVEFNNVFYDPSSTNFTAGGMFWCETPLCYAYNNTYVSAANNSGAGQPNPFQAHTANSIWVNNIASGTALGMGFVNAGPNTADYNDYWQCCGPSPKIDSLGYNNGSYYGSLASWQALGYDIHGSVGNPLLNASSSPPFQLTSNASTAWQSGKNLTSICTGQPNPGLGALCSDYSGTPRPTTGAWDMGAFETSATGFMILSPTSNNYGSINVGSSSSSVTFSLTNNSVATATSVSPTVTGGNTGDFPVTNSGSGSCNALSGTLTVGSSCTFTVKFSPSAVGPRSTTLSVSYSGGDGASPQTAPLSGTGVVNTYPAPPMSLIVVLN